SRNSFSLDSRLYSAESCSKPAATNDSAQLQSKLIVGVCLTLQLHIFEVVFVLVHSIQCPFPHFSIFRVTSTRILRITSVKPSKQMRIPTDNQPGGSDWLLPAAVIALQCVKGKKSVWQHPVPASAFTLEVCIKIAEEKQAAKKLKFSAARAPEFFC